MLRLSPHLLLLLLATSLLSAAEGLTRAQAEAAVAAIAAERAAELKKERAAEVAAKVLQVGDKSLRWLEKEFNLAPEGQRSLWISMHGGGGAPAAVNDQQWRNQIRLYAPAEGIVVAPRAPTNTWNLWHEGHIDPMFARLIDDFVAVRGVHPAKVYLLGYSAGGDGVWQLAPRMPDRFAAASMMAGHTNGVNTLGVRNLPFAMFVGGADAAYNRNKVVAEKIAEFDRLQKEDPEGYTHLGRVYEGLPHWMNLKDAEALPWMAQFTRQAWPKQVVWVQTGVTHDKFYWLQVPAAEAKPGQKLVAKVSGQSVALTGDVPKGVALRLSDGLVNLDEPVTVTVNGQPAFRGKVPRSEAVIRAALAERLDPQICPTALLTL
jgi:pimeloyl-ACP methyl ester carboxylesterase